MLNNKKKILVVEGSDDQRLVIQVALERSGYAVAEAAGAHYGLLRAELSTPNLILLGTSLAGHVDGWEVLRRLKASDKTASIPVVIMGVQAHEARSHWARRAGASDYLVKPYRMPTLLLMVERILASQSMTGHEQRSHLVRS